MIEGGCFCGAVRYQIEGALGRASACHCSRCRKAFSSASSAYAEIALSPFKSACSNQITANTRASGPRGDHRTQRQPWLRIHYTAGAGGEHYAHSRAVWLGRGCSKGSWVELETIAQTMASGYNHRQYCGLVVRGRHFIYGNGHRLANGAIRPLRRWILRLGNSL